MSLETFQNYSIPATFAYGLDLFESASKENVQGYDKCCKMEIKLKNISSQPTNSPPSESNLPSFAEDNPSTLSADLSSVKASFVSNIFLKKCVQVGLAALNVTLLMTYPVKGPLFSKVINLFGTPLIPAVGIIGLVSGLTYLITDQLLVRKYPELAERYIVRKADLIGNIAHGVMIISSFAIAYFSASVYAFSFAASLTLGMLDRNVLPAYAHKYVDWPRFVVQELMLFSLSNMSIFFPLTAVALLAGKIYESTVKQKSELPKLI